MSLDFSKRRLRKRQRQVEAIGVSAESLAERHFFRRLDRLVAVRRFIIGWLLFFVLICGCLVGQIRALDGHFRHLSPVPGGIYTEGILGDFTTANPLYASGEVDESVAKLVFAGLMTYDQQNKLVGDMAEGYTVDATEKIYTVTLRPNLSWHDGAPLTARDVLFTYKTIQNPDTMSSLNQSWKDITVAAPDDRTVTFTLPNPLSAFPYQITNGIIPEHLLRDVAPNELRSTSFNTIQPVGSGPFMWQKIQVSGDTPETREEQIALAPFTKYHGGEPKLASFVIHAFHDADRMATSFKNRELTAASFLELPGDAKEDSSVQTKDLLLTAANMVFFKESSTVLADANVRKALVQSANVPDIMSSLGYVTRPVKGPFLQSQSSYDPTSAQAGYDVAAAGALLDKAGWIPGANGIRVKGGVPLMFSLLAQDTPENRVVAQRLTGDWKKLGVQATLQLREDADIQRSINDQNYEALLYGISIGVDPDIYAYWHSSQKDPRSNRLNFSQFSSKVADAALEGGRTRNDLVLRAAKYKPFLQAWQQDTPALGLYQPRYLYATHGTVYGLDARTINTDTDRFNNVANWQIRQAPVNDR